MPVDEVARGRPGYALGISASAMAYAGMVRWFEHGVWSWVARAERSIYGETVRPGLATASGSTGATVPPNDAAYEGPTIYAAPALTRFTWIANGAQSPERQFGAPRVLRPAQPKALDVCELPANSAVPVNESPRAESLDLDNEDPGTDDTEGQDATLTEVRILGPVEVLGWRVVPDRPILTELVCYLVLHRDRWVSGEALRAALRPDEVDKEQSAKTLRTYLSMLRKSLGRNALPNATSAGYRLADTVVTDWDRFRQLSEMADLQSKLDALKLIRGQPFEDIAADSYAWVFREFWISDLEVAVVTRAKEAARMCRAGGRPDDALWALRQGLLAVRSDFTLWDMYLAFASEAGEAPLRRAQHEARAALGDDAPC
jgi:hypothetical protein